MRHYLFRVIWINFLLFLCCAGDALSLSSALKVEYPTKYEYHVTLGENLIYNVNFYADGGFINDSVYEEIDQWVRTYAVSTNNKKLEKDYYC